MIPICYAHPPSSLTHFHPLIPPVLPSSLLQMHAESTMKDLLLWVSRHLETFSRDPTARKLEEEPTYLESCVRRSLRY